MYRFTDWNNELNDVYGTYKQCLKLFNEAVRKDPEGRYSIYDTRTDEGILFNKNCPEYNTN